VGFAGASEIEHPSTEQGDHISGTTSPRHLGAEPLVGVARHQLLGFANRFPYHRSVADSFQYTVRDKLGALSNTATVSLRVQPAPSAANDTATLAENQSITINVLANDTSDGGTLNAASLKIIVPPSHGTAAPNSSGAVLDTPTAGYSGLDTFQYTVQDNLGTVSNPATVSVEVTAAASDGSTGKGGGGAVGLPELLALTGFLLITSLTTRRSARVALTGTREL
jgi:hypothetical protein